MTKKHDLVEAPEATSIVELHMHNQTTVWGLNGMAAQNINIVKLADQTKSTEAKKSKG